VSGFTRNLGLERNELREAKSTAGRLAEGEGLLGVNV